MENRIFFFFLFFSTLANAIAMPFWFNIIILALFSRFDFVNGECLSVSCRYSTENSELNVQCSPFSNKFYCKRRHLHDNDVRSTNYVGAEFANNNTKSKTENSIMQP